MHRIVTLTFACLVSTSACASRVTTSYQPRYADRPAASARTAADVELVNAATPDRPHQVAATIEARVDGDGTEPRASLMWRMRERAASAGCDAVAVPGNPRDRVESATGACIVYGADTHVATSR